MFTRTKKVYDLHVVKIPSWKDGIPSLDAKNLIFVPWSNESNVKTTSRNGVGRGNWQREKQKTIEGLAWGPRVCVSPLNSPVRGWRGWIVFNVGRRLRFGVCLGGIISFVGGGLFSLLLWCLGIY